MRIERLVIGRRQAVVLHAPDQLLDHAPRDSLSNLARYPCWHRGLVHRLAASHLRQDPHAPPRRDPQVLGQVALRQLARDIHRRIAHPDDDHVLAAQIDRIVGITIAVHVKVRAIEGAGVVRDIRIPVMAIAHEQDIVIARLAGR